MCSSMLGQNTHTSVGQDFICATSLPWERWPKEQSLDGPGISLNISEIICGRHQEFTKQSGDITSGAESTWTGCRKAETQWVCSEVLDGGSLTPGISGLCFAQSVTYEDKAEQLRKAEETHNAYFVCCCFLFCLVLGHHNFPEKSISLSFKRQTKPCRNGRAMKSTTTL